MTAAPLLDLYLDEIRRVSAAGAGTAETSYYPAISLLLNAARAKLKPRIYCLHHPSETARQIAATLLLSTDLDASYRVCAAAHFSPLVRA